MTRASTMVGTVALIAWAGQLAAAETAAPSAAANPTAEAAVFPSQDAQRKQLDLRAPDVTQLYSPEQIARAIGTGADRNIEEVEVEGERGRIEPVTPQIWPGIAAPFWALLHPAQAWRIILPLPPDQTRYMNTAPPDTSGYLQPAASHANASLSWN